MHTTSPRREPSGGADAGAGRTVAPRPAGPRPGRRVAGGGQRADTRKWLARALLLEDNPKLAAAITDGLNEQGFAVDAFQSGARGEEAALLTPYDAMIIDVLLPDGDGLAVCRALRRRHIDTPILVVSVISDPAERAAYLNAGADDHLIKPFEFPDLVARLRALLRRGRAVEAAVLRIGDAELDLIRRCVNRGGVSIRLTDQEFVLLEYFMRKAGRVLTRAEIGRHVWGLDVEPSSNVIDVYVSMLRRKIDRDFQRPLIHTIVGAGYMFGLNKP